MSKHHGFQDLVEDSAAAPVVSIGAENGLPDVLYLQEPGSAMAISMGDINQGTALGDCFLLSALGEIARQSVIQDDTSFIPSMIHPQANGTENVTLFQENYSTGKWSPVTENVTNVFVPGSVNSLSQASSGGKQEIWPQVIEKAAGQLMGAYPTAIANGGYTFLAQEMLSGQASTVLSAQNATLANLNAWSGNNDLISFDTGADDPTHNIVGDHSYMFNGVVGTGASAQVRLQNPWGFDQPALIPISALTGGLTSIYQIDVGHFDRGAGHGTAASF